MQEEFSEVREMGMLLQVGPPEGGPHSYCMLPESQRQPEETDEGLDNLDMWSRVSYTLYPRALE